MTEEDRRIAGELKERLLAAGGGHVRRIVVFGSRARGDAEPDSDLDLAVLVDEERPGLEQALDDAAYEWMWDRNFVPIVTLLVFSEANFEEGLGQGFSFHQSVIREGVAL